MTPYRGPDSGPGTGTGTETGSYIFVAKGEVVY